MTVINQFKMEKKVKIAKSLFYAIRITLKMRSILLGLMMAMILSAG
jgi:hypothetical protein